MRYSICTKIVGVSFKNSDNTSRQELIRKLQLDEKLTIEHEENNPYDKNSHVIKNKDNIILGHINRELSEELIEKKESGQKIIGIKSFKVTGQEKRTLGLNIIIELEKKDDWNSNIKIEE